VTVSVVIATFNGTRFVATTIQSVHDQSPLGVTFSFECDRILQQSDLAR
jgi:glycosyltransferase involved in cell wall biosynthesis